MDFQFSSEHEQLRETVRRFSESVMAPLVAEAEEHGFDVELVEDGSPGYVFRFVRRGEPTAPTPEVPAEPTPTDPWELGKQKWLGGE